MELSKIFIVFQVFEFLVIWINGRNKLSYKCGGTLLNQRYVITAAGDVVSTTKPTSSPCTTPDGTVGECKLIHHCKPVMALPSTEFLIYATKSFCGWETQPPTKICCPATSFESFLDAATNNSNQLMHQRTNKDISNSLLRQHLNTKSTPTLNDCSKRAEAKILGGEIPKLEQFPWMALLVYKQGNKLSYKCGGTLINQRYVITAAHCIKSWSMRFYGYSLYRVRLGEYNLKTEIDCVVNEFGEKTCTRYKDYDIQTKIIHEKYNTGSFFAQPYDIGLIKLSEDVIFTPYISPACISTGRIASSEELYAIGWGHTAPQSLSDVKMMVRLPLANFHQCKKTWVNIGFGQFCAGGEEGKDTCQGDSGGPLMSAVRVDDHIEYWKLVGMTSFGPKNCGTKGSPAVYTSVWEFLPWIEEIITKN